MNDALLALDASARMLRADDLLAAFLPGRGMLGASLQHRGEELLGRVEDIESFSQRGRTCGIPLLHPWANRLSDTRYRAAGREVVLDSASSLIGHDDAGLPMHGIPWSHLAWQVTGEDADSLHAQLEWTSEERLADFPYPHRLEMNVLLNSSALRIATTLVATGDLAVPVSFGFHPYLRLPGLPRAEWRVHFPAMSQLILDEHQIPTGETAPFSGLETTLGDRAFDDGFTLLDKQAAFSITGGGWRIGVEFVEGYTHAQIFAPRDKNYLAIEPMTAPANALLSGHGLRLVEPGDIFLTTFRLEVERSQ